MKITIRAKIEFQDKLKPKFLKTLNLYKKKYNKLYYYPDGAMLIYFEDTILKENLAVAENNEMGSGIYIPDGCAESPIKIEFIHAGYKKIEFNDIGLKEGFLDFGEIKFQKNE